jgi:uncharacterized protein (DUF2141 family)
MRRPRFARPIARAWPFLCAAFCVVAAEPVSAAALTVTVDNLRNGDGEVRLSAYAAPAEWLDNSVPDHDKVEPARKDGVVFHFDLPPGIYAVASFHDENGNGQFAQNFLGIPEEGYAFSNNLRPVFVAPSFEDASFTLPPEGIAMTIHMIYWLQTPKARKGG